MVDRLTPSCLAMPETVFSGRSSSSRTSRSCSWVSAGGRPSRLPRARAAARPSLVPAEMAARPRSASPSNTRKIASPPGLVVSSSSRSDRSPAPRRRTSATVAISSRCVRPSWSRLATRRMSPGRRDSRQSRSRGRPASCPSPRRCRPARTRRPLSSLSRLGRASAAAPGDARVPEQPPGPGSDSGAGPAVASVLMPLMCSSVQQREARSFTDSELVAVDGSGRQPARPRCPVACSRQQEGYRGRFRARCSPGPARCTPKRRPASELTGKFRPRGKESASCASFLLPLVRNLPVARNLHVNRRLANGQHAPSAPRLPHELSASATRSPA